MTNLDRAKIIIKRYYKRAHCGIFDSRNFVGDPMETVYNKNGLMIDICFKWAYFEVFGLTPNEFDELKKFYDSLEN